MRVCWGCQYYACRYHCFVGYSVNKKVQDIWLIRHSISPIFKQLQRPNSMAMRLKLILDLTYFWKGQLISHLRCPTWSECPGVWRVPRQHCCRGACQIVLSGTHDIWDSAWSCCETIVGFRSCPRFFGLVSISVSKMPSCRLWGSSGGGGAAIRSPHLRRGSSVACSAAC